MEAPRVKLSLARLHPSITEQEAGQVVSAVFQVLDVTRQTFEPSLPASVVRASLPWPLIASGATSPKFRGQIF